MRIFHEVLAAATRLFIALALVFAPWSAALAVSALAAPEAVAHELLPSPWVDSATTQIVAAPAFTATVTVGNGTISFAPATQTVLVSDTVHWLWNDTFQHSTTSGSCPGGVCGPPDGNWDSGLPVFGPGVTFDHVFTQTGTYTYYCKVHGGFGMTGTIEVVDFLPITGLAATNSSPTPLGSVTDFTATISAGNSVTYTWSFGDGQGDLGALTSHTYGATGYYTAVVTASNAISTVVAFTPVTITRSIYLPLILR